MSFFPMVINDICVILGFIAVDKYIIPAITTFINKRRDN